MTFIEMYDLLFETYLFSKWSIKQSLHNYEISVSDLELKRKRFV